jgi:hypothetical protein
MFSSAQVEFTRYWLINMGFGTKDEIMIPSSTYLLKENVELTAVSPAIYKTVESLKSANKVN